MGRLRACLATLRIGALLSCALACAPTDQATVATTDGGKPVLYVPASLAGVVAGLLPDSRRIVASTVVLARQIERGAQSGIFLSASPEWMDYLAARRRLEPGTRAEFARGRLVLVEPVLAASGSALPPARFCTGDPDYVPLGRYTRAVFENLGRWHSLRKHLLPASDARRARIYLQRGACRLGMLYASDVRANAGESSPVGHLRVLAEVPARLHPPVLYEIALVRSALPVPAARAAYSFLLNDSRAAQLLQSSGFTVDACSRDTSVAVSMRSRSVTYSDGRPCSPR